jgi:8-oxo-dGTP diphosphatase
MISKYKKDRRKVSMSNLDKALDILKENEYENQSIVNFIENNPIFNTEIVGNSVLVRGLSDQAWVYISSNDKAEFRKIIKPLNNEDKFFAAVEEWMIPHITVGRTIAWEIKTTRYILPPHVALPEIVGNIEPLNAKDANFIHKYSMYHQFTNSNYFKDRIYKGYSAGITENGKLIAWVLTQDDGAVAFLYVMKEQRRKGYANAVTLALLNKIRKTGRQPYVYISDESKEAKELALNFGFEKEKKVRWLNLT